MSGRGEAAFPPFSSLPVGTGLAAPPAERDVTPDWKPEKRTKATTKQWGILRHGINRNCAVCGDPSQSAHHIVRRSQGGDDVPENLMGLCGHGTRGCHGLAEKRHRPTLIAIRYALTAEQVAYVLAKKGMAWLDRAYPKPACVVCEDLGCSHCPDTPRGGSVSELETTYCPACWAEKPDDTPCSCQSFDALVDKLQALRGLERAEAEKLAEDILEDDAA